MDIFTVFLVIALSAGVHASFQLSVSVFTLVAGHKLSQKSPHRHLMKISTATILGVFITNILLFSGLAFLVSNFVEIFSTHSRIFWATSIGLLSGIAVSSWFFYWKKGQNVGTEIWLPRNFVNFLSKKSKTADHSAEAFSLGSTSVLAEIIFLFPPLLSATLATAMLRPAFQFVALTLYVFVANFPLFVVYCAISGGHSLSRVLMWRERNQHFLKLFASLSAIILAAVIFVYIFGDLR